MHARNVDLKLLAWFTPVSRDQKVTGMIHASCPVTLTQSSGYESRAKDARWHRRGAITPYQQVRGGTYLPLHQGSRGRNTLTP